jgi:hypothetical protein
MVGKKTKFKFKKRYVWIPAVIIIVLFITTGFQFEFIPVDAIESQNLLDDLNNLTDLFEIPFFDCDIVSECEDNFVETPPPITDIVYDCDIIQIPATDLFLQECPNIVLDPIENKTVIIDDMGTVTDPPPIVPPPEPIPLPPEPEPEPELFDVTITSIIFKTDNNGTRTESSTNTDVPILTQLSFFIEDTSNIDFDNGFLEQQLILNAPPNTQINVDADFDVLIANQTILPQPLTISISGTTDENGELIIDYVNPTGLKSKDFLFRFQEHVDKFPEIGTENIEFVLENVRATSGDFEFELESVIIYSFTIATDPNKIVILNEAGELARVFPTDDTLRIYSTPSTYTYVRTSRVYPYTRTYSACCYPAPAMGGGEVTHILQDGTEEIIAEFNSNGLLGCRAVFKQPLRCDSSTKVDIKIQRNEIYRIDFTSPTKASITFKTPLELKSYAFYCKGTSVTSSTSLGYCNFQQASVQKELADTLVVP